MNRRKMLKHLIISIVLFYILTILGALLNVSEHEYIFNLLTFLLFLDGLYIITSFILLMIAIIKYNKSKPKQKKINKNDITYHYNLNNDNCSNKEKIKKEKKKISIKFSDDRIYEEAVKHYGKSYVKNKDKADVVDEYLNEEKEMFEKKN